MSMATTDEDRYASLVQALTVIASEAAEQARLLPALTRIAAETREGTQVELLDVQLAREGVLPAETGFLIARIEEVLDELVGDQTGIAFTEHALRSDPRWKLARKSKGYRQTPDTQLEPSGTCHRPRRAGRSHHRSRCARGPRRSRRPLRHCPSMAEH